MIEFRDLKEQYKRNRTAIDQAISKVLCSANFIQGDQVQELELQLASYVGVKHCITCANGTDALQLSLMAWDIGKGDAVFVPDFTFFSSGEVVPLVGATPIFVDIDEDTYNISPKSLEEAIQYVLNKTDLTPKAIVAVDLFGQPADFKQIRTIANRYHLLVLEDAAQGFGGKIREQRACSFGDISTTSFFPAKPLGCYGDGGAIFTNNDEWATLLRSLCVHGKGTDKYDNVRIGMNSRLDTIQAAVLLEKLKFFDEEFEQCNIIAGKYSKALKDIVKTPVVMQGMQSSWAQYTVCEKYYSQRDLIIQSLKNEGIPTAVYYPKPLHKQRAFGEYDKINQLNYSVTEQACQCCLSLPMHSYITDDELESICHFIIDSGI